MPTPKKGEKQDEFISRCIPQVINDGTASDNKQAYAICISKWENRMEKQIDVREIVIKEDYGIDAIALVEMPAIEVDFLMFNKNNSNISFAKVDAEKRILTGPAMIPDKEIYRYDAETNEEYYVYFTKNTVEQISQKYLINNKQSNVNLEHEIVIYNVSIVESWIVTDPETDKAKALGFSVPKGTWMVSLKINNDEIWNKYVKTKQVKGFSIEGFFVEKFSKDYNELNKLYELLKQL